MGGRRLLRTVANWSYGESVIVQEDSRPLPVALADVDHPLPHVAALPSEFLQIRGVEKPGEEGISFSRLVERMWPPPFVSAVRRVAAMILSSFFVPPITTAGVPDRNQDVKKMQATSLTRNQGT
jgi:hypothetical protein